MYEFLTSRRCVDVYPWDVTQRSTGPYHNWQDLYLVILSKETLEFVTIEWRRIKDDFIERLNV